MDGDEVCIRFDNYPFLEDQNFLSGWLKIRERLEGDPQDLQLTYLQAKIFYYSRQVESLTLDTYLNWLQSTGNLMSPSGNDVSSEQNITDQTTGTNTSNISINESKKSAEKLETDSDTYRVRLNRNPVQDDSDRRSINSALTALQSHQEHEGSLYSENASSMGDNNIDCVHGVSQTLRKSDQQAVNTKETDNEKLEVCSSGQDISREEVCDNVKDTTKSEIVSAIVKDTDSAVEESGNAEDMAVAVKEVTDNIENISIAEESSLPSFVHNSTQLKDNVQPEQSATSATSGVSSDKDDRGDNLSLAELMECVEAGLPIPGVTDLGIEPTNSDVTASEVQRHEKPWEK